MKFIQKIALLVSLLFTCYWNLNSFANINRTTTDIIQLQDSSLYMCDTVRLKGYMYSCTSKNNTDYDPKVFKFFINGGMLSDTNKLSINLLSDGNYIVLNYYDFNRLSRKINNSSLLNRVRNLSFISSMHLVKTYSLKNKNKIDLFLYDEKFTVGFIDVNIIRTLFWIPSEIKLPQEGYVKILIPN